MEARNAESAESEAQNYEEEEEKIDPVLY